MRRLLPTLALLLVACGPQGDAFNEPADGEPVLVRGWGGPGGRGARRPFTHTVEVEQADGVEFELPDPAASITGLVLMNVDSKPAESAGGRTLYHQEFQLKAPKPGTYLIPGVEGPWRRGDEVGTAGSGPILVEAKRTGGTEEAGDDVLRDLKAVAAPDPNRRRSTPADWPSPCCCCSARGWPGGAQREADLPPPTPPWEVARHDLKRLERSGAADAPDQGPFAFEVSAILRRYLEARFGFTAYRMTTPEVLRAPPTELARDLQVENAIRTVLEASDRVKFAGEPVPRAELDSWSAACASSSTRPPPPTEEDTHERLECLALRQPRAARPRRAARANRLCRPPRPRPGPLRFSSRPRARGPGRPTGAAPAAPPPPPCRRPVPAGGGRRGPRAASSRRRSCPRGSTSPWSSTRPSRCGPWTSTLKTRHRLQVVKKVVNDFIGRRVNDRIGLVVFGEEALIQCPHTTDYGVLRQTLAAVKRGMAGNTAIGNA